ncbi:MAG: hypothetical protein AB1403_01200 [Candidatus Riflebacteria bacterium]
MNAAGNRRRKKSGFILYLVFALLAVWGIFVFALSNYKSGAVNILSKTSLQSRLTCVANSAASEIWAMMRNEANDYSSGDSGSFGSIFNEVFSRSPQEKPPVKIFTLDRAFGPDQLPFSSALGGEITGNDLILKANCRVFFTKLIRNSPESFLGHIEIIVFAASKSDKRDFIEIKERRDFKIIDSRDFTDDYALFVKDYCYDFNKTEQRLEVEGIKDGRVSRIYAGSRYAPGYKETAAAGDPAPLFFDICMKDDANLIPLLLNNKTVPFPSGTTELPSSNQTVKQAASGNIFWSVSSPIDFKPIFDRAGFSDSDFYSVKALQDGYYKTFVETARQAGSHEHSITGLILQDWQECGGDYSSSRVFKMVVKTSVDSWKYIYAYTDAASLWQGTDWTSFAKVFQLSGLNEYVKFMKDFNPDKMISGKMAAIFGAARDIPLIIEGNAYLRFFKVAFFDEFEASITLAGASKLLGMPAIPLHFQDPGASNQNFLNKKVSVHGFENVLMSREVGEVPLNSLFNPDAGVAFPPTNLNPEDVFPTVSVDSISYRYKTPAEFIADRSLLLPDGSKHLNLDGLMFIESGNLDLSSFSKYHGKGVIWIGFKGDILIGDLQRSGSDDVLKIWAQDGNFIIKSQNPLVRIDASLIATSYFVDPNRDSTRLVNRGKLIPNGHGIEVNGNLVVDYLFLADSRWGVPSGKKLVIKHDPIVFKPENPKWVSIGQIRSIYNVSSDPDTSFFLNNIR